MYKNLVENGGLNLSCVVDIDNADNLEENRHHESKTDDTGPSISIMKGRR